MALSNLRACAAATLASGRVSPAAARTVRRPARRRCAKPAKTPGLGRRVPLYPLQTIASIPARVFAARRTWPEGTYVIPGHAFAADLTGLDVALSMEHTAVRWLDAKAAQAALRFDSNRTALEELAERLVADDLPDPVR